MISARLLLARHILEVFPGIEAHFELFDLHGLLLRFSVQ